MNETHFLLTDTTDIQIVSNEIILPPDSPRGCIAFSIVDDDFVEGDHTVTWIIDHILSESSVTLNMMMNTHLFTIMDNDGEDSEIQASI